MNFIRDGALAAGEYGSRPNYWPNTVAGTPAPDRAFADPAWDLGQAVADRFDSTVGHDDFTQPGDLYRLFDEAHRDRLTTRIAGALGQARKDVQMLQVCHFFLADPDYGRRVAEKLGIDLGGVRPRRRPPTRQRLAASEITGQEPGRASARGSCSAGLPGRPPTCVAGDGSV